jgi:hypothetical protein
MARYVLVAFDNDIAADEFVQAVERPGGFFFLGSDGHFRTANITDDPTNTTAFVRGVWQKATKFCDCQPGGKKQERGFTRSKKYAWWVHADCGKPTKLWASGEHFFYSLGKNLLPVSAEAPEWRGEGVHGHNWDPETKQWIHHETGEVWNPGKALADLRTKYGFQ